MAEKKTLTLSTTTLSADKKKTLTADKGADSGIAVQRRKRRVFSEDQTVAVSSSDVQDEEMKTRLEALERAQATAAEEQKKQEEEKLATERLMKARKDKEEQDRKAAEEKARKEAEEQERKAAEDAANLAAADDDLPKKESKRVPVKEVKQPKADDAAERQAKKAAKAGNKDIAKKRGGRNAYLEDLEQRHRTMPSQTKRFKQKNTKVEAPKEKVLREVTIPEFITIQELANRMSERGADVVKSLMMMGQMVTVTQTIDQETAAIIVEEFGHSYKLTSESEVEENIGGGEDNAEDLQTRSPVVTVMGHVDHGKTSLLDAIRSTDVVDGEAGGITQHIGAYQITRNDGQKLTFLDTPGHEAFTSMRARGASVTDVVVLVVAADDGVMPQTIEAIKHAKAAEVPIIVAVNKIDKPGADPMRVKTELMSYELIAEDMGGDTVFVEVSAKQRQNIGELEEMILLQSEVLDLKANPNREAEGAVVESRLDKGRGAVATIIVQRGTLKVGDIFVAGTEWGRVRALISDHGDRLEQAGPSTPVEILGLNGVPEAGDNIIVVDSEKKAREVAEYRSRKKREEQNAARSKMSLENLFDQISQGDVLDLPVVVKADVQGSAEAINESLQKLSTEEVKVSILHSAVGGITESDVMLANASQALIVGFNVRANNQARKVAETEGVEIRYYNVIYDLLEEVRSAMTGMLAPVVKEQVLGTADVRETFHVSKIGTIAGCMVSQGIIRRNAKARVIRDGVVLHDGELGGLKRFKDDAKEVREGFECGLSFTKFDDIRDGDQIECYELVEEQAQLGAATSA